MDDGGLMVCVCPAGAFLWCWEIVTGVRRVAKAGEVTNTDYSPTALLHTQRILLACKAHGMTLTGALTAACAQEMEGVINKVRTEGGVYMGVYVCVSVCLL